MSPMLTASATRRMAVSRRVRPDASKPAISAPATMASAVYHRPAVLIAASRTLLAPWAIPTRTQPSGAPSVRTGTTTSTSARERCSRCGPPAPSRGKRSMSATNWPRRRGSPWARILPLLCTIITCATPG